MLSALEVPRVAMPPQPDAAELQRRLEFLQYHDALTFLPNHLLLRQKFEQAAAPAGGQALLAVELHDFKQVRDNIGRARGESLLLLAVARLQSCLRPHDILGHQGGCEFLALLPRSTSADAVQRACQALHLAFAEPFEMEGFVLTLSLSIGIALCPADGNSYDELERAAGIAVACAAEGGRGISLFCTGQMRRDTVQRMAMHAQLRNAVVNGELLLHYQPQVDIASGRIIGAEALLRWQRGGRHLELPANFIPLAERTGLIVAIGDWVLNEACRQARAWQDGGLPPLTVAVNLSALQFRSGNIVAAVAEALERSGLAPACLELELTESVLLHDSDGVNQSLQALKSMGVALSIDDFGTGYSNLSYLKSLAVDKLKIDRSFVRGVGDDPGNSAIVKAIVQLCHALQLSVVAEGVEHDRQLAVLAGYGCDEAQGYYFSRPLAAGQFAALLADSARYPIAL
jgi:diguanylate cyclase (GGDEF)-like protein